MRVFFWLGDKGYISMANRESPSVIVNVAVQKPAQTEIKLAVVPAQQLSL